MRRQFVQTILPKYDQARSTRLGSFSPSYLENHDIGPACKFTGFAFMPELPETALYAPIKAFLEGQGYEVKSEISNCDVVALRESDAPVIVELKSAFSLPLLLQGVRRQAISDCVYLAFPAAAKRGRQSTWHRHYRDIIKLCRRLGLGLISVRIDPEAGDHVDVHVDPGAYQPRKNKRRQGLLLREFQRRVGDPNTGGMSKRPIVTAYRQDALKCASYMGLNGPSKAAMIKSNTGVSRAPRILQRDVYGWFQRTERGVYELTPKGHRALDVYADIVKSLAA